MRDFKRSTNSLETRRIRKILNEEARLGISPNSESETEEVDLQKELHPLSHYINNREEMIEQMFSVIKGPKLKKMLPPILKDMPLDELKADCLIHLLGMSKKRIRAILDGREINSSSNSETHSDSSSSSSKRPRVNLKPFVIKQEGCSDISDNSEEVVLVDPDLDFLHDSSKDKQGDTAQEKRKSKRKLLKKDRDKKHKRIKTKIVGEDSESDEVEELDSSAESDSENETEAQAPKEGKTLLEILELEMRARAIRALLKNNETQEDEQPQNSDEGLTQKPTDTKKKSNKQKSQMKEGTAERITPAKNFRKKKQKNDDIIIIAPKVVTIDLTDENEQSDDKHNKVSDRGESVPSSSQINLHGKAQEPLVNNSSQLSDETDKSFGSEKTTITNEEISRTKDQDISDVVASCCDEKKSKTDSLDKTTQSENAKSSWAQRWLESKEVKKVVSTSKICGSIRKKIKNAKLAKKQNQDEPVKLQSAPQQEMVGSVVEYKLLSKSKIVASSDNVNGDSQTSVPSVIQEPTSSKIDVIETTSADQVQDVSSTRVENSSTYIMQEAALSLQIDDEKTAGNKIESSESVDITAHVFDSHNEVFTSNVTDEKTDGPLTVVEKVETPEPKDLNKTEDANCESETIYSTKESKLNETERNCENKNPVGNKEAKENFTCSQTELCVSSVTADTEADQTESKYIEEQNSSIPSIEEAVANSKVIDNSKNESDSSSKNNTEQNLENEKKSFEIENKDLESNLREGHVLQGSNTLTDVLKECKTNPTQELNELETLQINITDEDRNIEDVIDENSRQNDSKSVKDTIIVIN